MKTYLPGFEPNVDDWTSDDWQTPTSVARAIAGLVQEDEYSILDPCAGTGQLVTPFEDGLHVVALEAKPIRARHGEKRCRWVDWYCCDFFAWKSEQRFDLIIANPPFSLRMEFIERSLTFLRPHGRLLFLMPVDFNLGLGMGNRWKALNCHIHHQYDIQNRVAYLDQHGTPQKGRQIYDAVFDIRHGQSGAVRSFL